MTKSLPELRLQTLERLFAAFNAHDIDGVMDCMTEDVVFETAFGPDVFGSRITGRTDVAAAFEAVWSGIPDVQWHVGRHGIDGDHGITEWVFAGTKEGDAIRREGLDLFRFDGAAIRSKRAFRKSQAG